MFLLSCFCGSPTDAEAVTTPNQLTSRQSLSNKDEYESLFDTEAAEELLKLQQGLSRISGSLTHRLQTLLAAFTPLAAHASVYGYVDGEEDRFVLLFTSGKDVSNRVAGAEPPTSHACVLRRMLLCKRPVSERIPPAASTAATAAACSPGLLCALPLFDRTAVAGALLLEATSDHPRTKPQLPDPYSRLAPGARPPSSSRLPRSPPSLLTSSPLLHQLGLAASVALSSDAEHLQWLSAAVHRISSSNSMHSLVAGLCEDLAAHASRRFIVRATVRAALLPRHDAPVGLLFQAADGMPADGLPAWLLGSRGGGSRQAGMDAGGGGIRMSQRTSQDAQLHSQAQQLAAAVAGVAPQAGGAGGAGHRGGGALSSLPSRHKLMVLAASSLAASDTPNPRAARAQAHPHSVAETTTPSSARLLAFTSDALAMGRISAFETAPAGTTILPNPVALSATPASSNRAIVIQLPTHLVNPTDAPCPAMGLHAQAFPLRNTLLQGLAPTADEAVGCDGGGGGGGGAGFRGVSIEDVGLYLQNVHNPARDVCLLVGSARGATVSGVVHPGSPRVSSAVAVGNPHPAAAGGGGGTGGVGLGAAGLGSGSGAFAGAVAAAATGSSAPQSLLLVGAQLGEAVLAFYLCFPKRLPGELLEAVRESCQGLLEEVLLGPIRAKLAGSLAPEFDTLRSPTPGHFAVLRSPSVNGLLARPASNGGIAGLLKAPSRSIATPRVTATSIRAPSPCGDPASPRGLSTAAAGRGQCGPAVGEAAGEGPSLGRHGAPSTRLARGASMELYCSSPGEVAACSGVTNGAQQAARTTSFTAELGCSPLVGPHIPSSRHHHHHNAASRDAFQPVALANDELLSALLAVRQSETTACSLGDPRSASILTVTGVDPLACMRQQLDMLVTSIQTTMTMEGAGAIATYAAEDLEQLELLEVLGKGGGGVVYKGRLGTQEVAVKVMELPDVDSAEGFASGTPAAVAPGGGVGGGGSLPNTPRAGGGGGLTPQAAAAAAKEQLKARRTLLRNAMEMAVQGRVSHPNLIQVYATYTNVLLERRRRADGSFCHCLVPAEGTPQDLGLEGEGAGNGAICCAIVAELADGGSLATALSSRIFPRIVISPQRTPPPPPPAQQQQQQQQQQQLRSGGNMLEQHPFQLDMKGVYMTLLDVALALRHLHSVNLVHRDIKPANLLLKSNPRDHRGFTVKLADFGFVLQLTEVAEDGTRYATVDQACGTVTHMAPELLPGKARVEASADIYSFGILMWELMAGGVRPFPHLHPDLIPRHVYKGSRPIFSDTVPLPYRGLAQACWSADPHRRPKAADVVACIHGQLHELE